MLRHFWLMAVGSRWHGFKFLGQLSRIVSEFGVLSSSFWCVPPNIGAILAVFNHSAHDLSAHFEQKCAPCPTLSLFQPASRLKACSMSPRCLWFCEKLTLTNVFFSMMWTALSIIRLIRLSMVKHSTAVPLKHTFFMLCAMT